MKSLTGKRVVKILEDHGFLLSRQRGSHMVFYNSETNISVPVPLHGGNKPINIGTFLAIVKQSKIPKQFWN